MRDNGSGMDASHPTPERYGLVGIRERADAIGARVRFESELGAGTTVHSRTGGNLVTSVLLADDHQMLRQAVRRALEDSGLTSWAKRRTATKP